MRDILLKLRAIGTVCINTLGAFQIFKWIEKLLGWGEHAEFVAHRLRDLGEVGIVLEFLLDPPPALGLTIVVAGLLLIWLNLRHHNAPPTSSTNAADFEYRRMLALAGMIIFGLGFVGSAAVYFWPQRTITPAAPLTAAATPSPPQKPWRHELVH
jgi:hypothetical protein